MENAAPPHSVKHRVLPPAGAWQPVKVSIECVRAFKSRVNRDLTAVFAQTGRPYVALKEAN